VHCKGEKKENLIEKHTPFPMVKEIHTETSTLKTLKIMPRKLREIVVHYVHEFGFSTVALVESF
jgi:hypothetical protein